ncbi:MAG: SymE family type I addiction module toxin [Verrucomicrobia bacterium]|nr:SymE family type I addiction module toxin [Verrucomicrobiota bacterium]
MRRDSAACRPAPAARRLTVSRLGRPCVSEPGYAQVPLVRIAGRWLESMGFRIGGRIAVEVEPERLVVTVVEKEG